MSRCRECVGRRLAFLTARAAVAYDGPARPLVRAWKERGLRHVADLAAELVAAQIEPPSAEALTWVPTDRDRELTRGHHPAERLARALAHRWEIEPRPLLGRSGRSRRQVELHLDERRRNVRGAFHACEGEVPRTVILVDDIYTTGATVDAAASALRAGGARRVEVVTFARAVR